MIIFARTREIIIIESSLIFFLFFWLVFSLVFLINARFSGGRSAGARFSGARLAGARNPVRRMG
ncbi:hypothetical protein [Frankia sp. EAN1pec]|uniref:hypothetical protein n=1 Tax=Parafrankia sp. (strain EAN1pec) TaxID=298653 RepID=UPI0012F710F1